MSLGAVRGASHSVACEHDLRNECTRSEREQEREKSARSTVAQYSTRELVISRNVTLYYTAPYIHIRRCTDELYSDHSMMYVITRRGQVTKDDVPT